MTAAPPALSPYILGVGAQTAVGRSARAAAAAVRAGVANFTEHGSLLDEAGEPVITARAPWLPEECGLAERLASLARAALQESLGGLADKTAGWQPRVSVVLGLPAARPGLPEALDRLVFGPLEEALPKNVRLTQARTLVSGHAAGLAAVADGVGQIRAGGADFCLAGGVDSYLAPETLRWLEANGQLHSAANSWGFIPGEAAGFCLLASAQSAERLGVQPLGSVLAVATAHETRQIKTKTICLGEGLTQTFQQTLRDLPPGVQVDELIGDLNGEPYRADELGFAMIRTARHFRTPGAFRAPADCWGDVGAASGVLFLALAAAAGQGGYARGPLSLVWAGSEGGDRGAALLHVPPRPREPLR